jgi:hypothetical protein
MAQKDEMWSMQLCQPVGSEISPIVAQVLLCSRAYLHVKSKRGHQVASFIV